jgi:putative intracellular protease/amidase
MELKGRKAIVLIEDMYNDYEFIYPYYRLLEAGAEVFVVGPEARPAPPPKARPRPWKWNPGISPGWSSRAATHRT